MNKPYHSDEVVNQIGEIAYCGLTCRTCPIYLATREKNKKNQEKLRDGIIKLCKEQYGIEYTQEDITDCDGCKTENERLFSGCRKCYVRNCARNHKYENCAYCDEYPCEKLNEIFVMDAPAKTRLDKIRNNLM